MSDAVTLVVESEVVPGKLDELKAVIQRLVKHIGETERDTLLYTWNLNDAGTEARVIEHYANSDAILFHAQNYAEFAKELASLRKIKKVTICGNASPQVTDAFAAINPGIFTFVEGHAK